MADIVDDFLARLRNYIPNEYATTDRLTALEVDIRAHWGGGDRVRVAKRPTLVKQHQIGLALQQGAGVKEAFRRAGVDVRRGYQILARKVK